MSGYGQAIGYAANQAKMSAIQPARRVKRTKVKKMSLKQRIRNWLLGEELDQPVSEDIETASIQSDGMRLQVYRAHGGFVVETRSYDRAKDRNYNSIHVITEDEDLGDRLGKIVVMETLRG